MDPLSAIGIASAVAQFIDVGFKIGKRLAEYNKASPNEVPRSLQSINTQLPLLVNALQRVKSDVEVNKFDFDTRCILKGVISGCVTLVEEVEHILIKVAKAPGESLASKVRKSFASFKQDEKILAIDKNLQTYINVLILHHVIDGDDVPKGLPEEIEYYEVKEKRADPFYDRDHLLQRLEKLFHDVARSQTKEPTVVILVGNSGVGKTQLAAEYSRQTHQLGQFRTVFWLDASSPKSFVMSMEATAAVIRRSTEGNTTEKVEFVKDFLSERWHPWLLVLDGYEHKAFDGIDLEQSFPSAGYGAILITTTQKPVGDLGHSLEVSKYLTAEEKNNLKWALQSAIQNERLGEVESCITRGAVINELDGNEWPHISRAAVYANVSIFKLLMDNGANPDFRRGLVAHPIYWASFKSPEIVNILLDYEDARSERQDAKTYERYFLHALESGQEEIAHSLISRRTFDLKAQDQYGVCSLQRAVEGGSSGFVKTLLDRDAVPADAKAKGNILAAAVQKGRLNMLRTLLSSPARHGFQPNLQDQYGKTALHHAVELRDEDDPWKGRTEATGLEITAYLLQVGASPNAPGGSDDETPLQAAALREFTEKIRLLLDHGGDVALADKSGYNALLSAAKYNSPSVFPLLLTPKVMPADAAARTEYLNKALQYGARNGNRELILAVLKTEGEVQIGSQDWRGQTPLLLAINGGHAETARMLLRQKPRPSLDIADKEGKLPLLVAAEKGFDLIVREILRTRGKPDQRDGKQDTALCLAAAKGHEKVVKVLLAAGADAEEGNRFGDTPLDLAEEKGFKEVVKLLEEVSLEKI